MPADAPRATAEDGFTPGDTPGDEQTEGTAEFRPGATSARPPAAEPGHRDIDAEDAGDPAEFAEPSARRSMSTPGDMPNFVGRSGGERGDGDGGDRGVAPNGFDGPEGFDGPDRPAGPDTDGIPPAPTLDPTVVGPGAVPGPGPGPGSGLGPGGPQLPPAHLRNEPGAPAPSPLASIRLPRVPKLRRRDGQATGRRQVRVRGARVNQRLWRVDPWSVFKVSALFYMCLFLILLVAGTLLWNVGRSSGTIDQFESFVTRLGAYGSCVPEDEVPAGTDFENDEDCPDGRVLVDGFELDDGTIFRAAALGGVVLVVAGSLGNVLMTVLVNLINEVSGGMRYTIIKEPAPRQSSQPAAGAGPPPGPGGSGDPPGPDGSTRLQLRR
jgi:hypothetical protein